MNKEESYKTPHAELCDKALEHYHEISTSAFHFNSLVVKAIEFYKEFGLVRDERSEESAEYLRGVKDGSEGKLFEKITVDTEIPRELVEPFIQAERTRIIKALEGLKNSDEKRHKWQEEYEGEIDFDIGYNQALQDAIKAVGESAEKGKE